MNKVILLGNIANDPEMRSTAGNNPSAVARFRIAVERRWSSGNDRVTDFINCIAIGKTAEFIGKYFSKGMKIAVEGRIQTGSYTNRDGQKVYTTDVFIENAEFAEPKRAAQNAAPAATEGSFVPAGDLSDDGLPFS